MKKKIRKLLAEIELNRKINLEKEYISRQMHKYSKAVALHLTVEAISSALKMRIFFFCVLQRIHTFTLDGFVNALLGVFVSSFTSSFYSMQQFPPFVCIMYMRMSVCEMLYALTQCTDMIL